ncbi:MAG: hypothetical protein LBQ80_05130 [Clostridium sp.]|jgi:hypothetical protein|nr:hypothetical protein [Clostridium sp.]
MVSLNLDKIIEYMEIYGNDIEENHRGWYDRRDGQIHVFSREVLGYIEDLDENEEPDFSKFPEWQREEVAEALAFYEKWDGKSLVSMPDRYEFNQYGIMEEYRDCQDNPAIYNQLDASLHGKGAFRRFKDTALRLGLLQQWYTFRDNAMLEKARQWCDENNIPYIQEKGGTAEARRKE